MKKLFLLLMLMFPLMGFSQGGAYNGQAIGVGPGGSLVPIPHALVRVCGLGATGTPCSPLATIYTDTTLSTQINQTTNPLYADAYGNYSIFAAGGNYEVQVSATLFVTNTQTYTITIGISTGIGNGTTVIDPTKLTAYSGAAAQINAASALCPVASAFTSTPGCTIDLRSYPDPQLLGSNSSFTNPPSIYEPESAKIIWAPIHWNLGCGVSIFHNTADRNTADPSIYGATFTKTCNTSDYTPIFASVSPQKYTEEFDHLTLKASQASGAAMAFNDIAAAATITITLNSASVPITTGFCGDQIDGSCTVYGIQSGNIGTSFNQQPLFNVVIGGFVNSGNNGTFVCPSWTTTTLTCFNSGGVAESFSAPTYPTAQVTGSVVTFSSTQSSCNANLCAGYQFALFPVGANPPNQSTHTGYYIALASTSGAITLATGGTHEATVTGYVQKAGSWGIGRIGGLQSSVHDLNMIGTGLGISAVVQASYINLRNLYIHTVDNPIYFQTSSVTADGVLNLGQSDVNSVLPEVWLNNASETWAVGLDLETSNPGPTQTGVPVWINGYNNTIGINYFECDVIYTYPCGPSKWPTLAFGAQQNVIIGGADVNDLSSEPGRNIYANNQQGNRPVNVNLYGSVQVPGISNPVSTGFAKPCAIAPCPSAGSGTNYNYKIYAVDFNGNKTLSSESTTSNASTLSASNGVVEIDFPYTVVPLGTRCFDVTTDRASSGTFKSIYLCSKPTEFPLYDDGSITPASYTAPNRNSTADISVSGNAVVTGAVTNGITTVTNTDNRGTITLNTGSGSYSFSQGPGTSGAWTTAPVCEFFDVTNSTHQVTPTVTTSSISLSGTGSDVINYHCDPGN